MHRQSVVLPLACLAALSCFELPAAANPAPAADAGARTSSSEKPVKKAGKVDDFFAGAGGKPSGTHVTAGEVANAKGMRTQERTQAAGKDLIGKGQRSRG